jgi:hypothetical protein
MVNLLKMAVGVRDSAHLRQLQRERAAVESPLRHRTRHSPKRAEEVTDGGSLYWVIGGVITIRQRIIDIRPDHRPDGSNCAALILDPELIELDGRLAKPFQGWRYLEAANAPPDLVAGAEYGQSLPSGLRRALKELCLL